MKNILILTLGLILVSNAIAQPFTALEASGSNKKIEWTTSNWGNGFGHKIYSYDPTGRTLLNIAARHNSSNWTNLMTFTSDGKVGINTENPKSLLTIGNLTNGNIETTGLTLGTDHRNIEFIHSDWSTGYGSKIYNVDEGNGKTSLRIATRGNSTNWSNAFYIEASDKTSNTFIGIGTTTPNNKLDVNGTIRAKEIKVETGWADHVFSQDYKLPTLQEEEAHIKTEGHLLGFQSEEEMNGTVLLGDVTKRQQVKIEELMLHVINLNRALQAQEQKITTLQAKLEVLNKE